MGEQQILESFRVKGTVESWIENVFNLVKDHPKAVFPLLASFASVIFQEYDMKPIVVDGDLSFVNNIGKLRGSITGSQHSASWRSILLTSGENEILAYAEAQGVVARVIPITDFSFEGEDKSFSRKLFTSFTDNHGAIGIEFLKCWKDKRTIYSREFEEYRKMNLEKSVENDVARRISLHYSFIVFTGKVLLNDLFNREGLDVDSNALEALFYNISNENKAVDRSLAAMENRKKWWKF
ncbi:MAG: hypothetical protein ACQEXK_20550 [Bacillota bacterium]